MLKQWVENNLPPQTVANLKTAVRSALAWWYRNDLNRLALLFRTDKWGSHWYTQHYDRCFRMLKSQKLNLLEIGVGGYDSSAGGGSLRMWRAYFRKSQIVGIDLYDKSQLTARRIDVWQCDQTDEDALVRLSDRYGGFDIVIDDGSHINEHVIGTFEVLFPLLRPNGIYAIEDTQTAYWPTWGGGVNNPGSTMAYFKHLADGLNYAEYPLPGYCPTIFEKSIVEISFFHNLIIIRSGSNDEKANTPELIEREIECLDAGHRDQSVG